MQESAVPYIIAGVIALVLCIIIVLQVFYQWLDKADEIERKKQLRK